MERFEIYGEKKIKELMNEYIFYYNYERLHGAIGYTTLVKYFVRYFKRAKVSVELVKVCPYNRGRQ